MRKFIPYIAICLFCLNINAQITEAYPTSQRYLFNPYNRDSVYIDSARHWDEIYDRGGHYTAITDPTYIYFSKINEYQMYPVTNTSPVQVYGVAIPLHIILSTPRGSKYFGYYWEEDNLGPRDDSVRNLYWQTLVDSMHVLWTYVTYDLTVSGEREVYERYIYFIQKNEDPQHPIRITDSVKIQYGINAVGWNRFQRPKLYNCTPQNYAHYGGYTIPTLEVYFDRPHNVNDTFFCWQHSIFS